MKTQGESTLLADLTLSYLGRTTALKGDAPGHEFRGNQYGHGSGGAGESAGRSSLPKPKVIAGHEIADSFVNKKGTKLYTLQKPTDGSDKGWAVISTMRRDKGGSPVHFYEATGSKDDASKEFNDLKKWHG